MPDSPSPCDSCTSNCGGAKCERWKIRYLYRQKQINAYAKRLAGSVAAKSTAWCYMHPDEYRRYLASDPCDGCMCQTWCDDPCPKYLLHFREKMEHLRKRAERQ